MDSLSVLPSLSDRKYHLVIHRLAQSMCMGANTSAFLGAGLLFQQTREYQPGDSVRLMDWKATARLANPQVKQFETTMRTPVYIVVDCSASMSRSSALPEKYAVAAMMAGGFAYAALASGNPVGIVRSDEIQSPQPTMMHQVVAQRVQRLRHFDRNAAQPLGETLQRMRETLRHRSAIVVLSDFHDACAVSPLRSLTSVHECTAIQLSDPLEEEGIRGAFIRIRPAEGSREEVASRPAANTSRDVREQLREAGVTVHRISLQKALDQQVWTLLQKAARRPCKENISSR